MVLVRDCHPGSKFRLPFESDCWTITRIQGTMVTAARGQERVTRNVSHFKKVIRRQPSGEIVLGSQSLLLNDEVSGSHESLVADEPVPQSPRTYLCDVVLRSPLSDPRPDSAGPIVGQRSQITRYHLQDNPPPSQRLQGYDLRG